MDCIPGPVAFSITQAHKFVKGATLFPSTLSFLPAAYLYTTFILPATITNFFSLKSITTILLLASFLVFQYARQVSYWECRLSNYFKTENQKCDCEKFVRQIVSQDEPSPVPAVHNHFHLDESFFPSLIISAEGICNTEMLSRFPARHIFYGKIIPGRLDRPPQIS